MYISARAFLRIASRHGQAGRFIRQKPVSPKTLDCFACLVSATYLDTVVIATVTLLRGLRRLPLLPFFDTAPLRILYKQAADPVQNRLKHAYPRIEL